MVAFVSPPNDNTSLFKSMVSIRTFVGIGVLLSILLPLEFAIAFAAVLLLSPTLELCKCLVGLDRPSEVIPGRHTAKLDGDFVVFHIGARSNNSINKLTKDFKWVGEAFQEMAKECSDYSNEIGFLGGQSYISTDGSGTLMIQYWRSQEQLLAYARATDNLHNAGWKRLMRMAKQSTDIGFYHETFKVRNGEYETIYVNMPRILLGRVGTMVPCSGVNSTASGRSGRTKGDDWPEEFKQ